MTSSKVLVLTLITVLQLLPIYASANSIRIYPLSADEWARPRSGGVIPSLEAVRLAVGYWETGSDMAIVLSYPGEDTGELWAAELKDWLVTLGVPSDYIRVSPGLQAETELRIMVGNRAELSQ